jgi:predicted  nucleic acid-binding Zn-ribbon protein
LLHHVGFAGKRAAKCPGNDGGSFNIRSMATFRSETMSKKIDGETQKAPDHIDQIRDIIFGAQKREYEHRFEQLESDLASFREGLQKQFDELNDVFAGQLANAVQSFDKRMKLLTTTGQDDTANLRKQVEQADKKFTNSISALVQESTESISRLHKDLSESQNKLFLELRNLKEQLNRDLESRLNILHETKVSKEAMAELFFEFGMKLKDLQLVAELQKVAKSRSED